jgi:hypothetical protein
MSRYIPANAETRDFPAAVVVAYCFESKNGPAYVAYKGRQGKPARFFAFVSLDRRDRHLSNYIDQQTEFEALKWTRRQTGHGLIVGDIVFSTWGYEQTNVDFFEVLRVPTDLSAVVRQIESETIEDKPGSMTGKTTAKPGQFVAVAKSETRRACGVHVLNGGKMRGQLQKWDGTPRRVTWYA